MGRISPLPLNRFVRTIRSRNFSNPAKHWLISLIWTALIFSGAPVNADPYSTDTDGDGYSDGEELAGGYDPNNSAVYPGYEASIDSDGDGYSDYDENNQGSNPSDPSSYPGSAPDPASQDTDGDGYSDTDETAAGTDPYSSTSYPGSYVDPYTIDLDGDGFTDGVESSSGTNPYDSANYPTYGPEYSPDTDGDTYSDADEVSNGTDPNNAASYPGSTYYSDSDWDGWSDGDEIAAGTDPSNSGSYPGAPDPYTTDSDGDGYYDYEENSQGTDPYSSTSYPGYLNSIDSDGDGHYDADEIAMGYNPNDPASFPGMQNSTSDSDGDGHSDYDENVAGTNPYDSSSYPGSYSYYDSDGDGYYDSDEYAAGTNPYDSSSYPGSTSNYVDSDSDGLYDSEEQSLGTNPNLTDSDDDGLSDYSEVRGIEVTLWVGDSTSGYGMSHTYITNPNNPDTDGDLLPDGWEINNGTDPTNAGDGLSDSDNDGLSLGREVTTYSTDPTRRDTDEDGEGDGYEVGQGTDPLVQSSRTSADTDGDVMSDQWETQYGLDPGSATDASGDGDNDGLINLREYHLGTSPANPDSDNDNYKDGFEWDRGFNPLYSGDASHDSDADSMPDLWELFYGLDPGSSTDRSTDSDGDWVQAEFEFSGGFNPNNADTDGDGISDYDEYYGIIQPPLDSDGDQINDSEEIAVYETDPYDADSDDDGISDHGEIFGTIVEVSFNGQTLGVGFVTNPNLADTDEDGMDDHYEIHHFFDPTDLTDGSQDEDGDTIFNGIETSVYTTDPFKSDTDEDGESDSLELAQGTDPLNPDSNFLDSDEDLMRDSWELANGLDPEDPADATGNPDDDGLVNLEEFQNNTNPRARDSDDDGYEDRFELIHGFSPSDPTDATIDTDEDDMPDLWELSYQLDPSHPGDAEDDFDSDLLLNVDEFTHGTRPDLLDTDLDGLTDFVELFTPRQAPPGETPTTSFTDPLDSDSDGDLLTDGFEVSENLEPLIPSDGGADRDADGLSNGAEVSVHHTDWKLHDTDFDGESDGFEIENETNPLDIVSRTSVDADGDHMSDEWEIAKGLNPQVANGGEDPDNDNLNNHGEYLAGTDPKEPDTDNDTYLDGFERSHGKDPLNPADAQDDTDEDLLPDLWEMLHNLPWQNPTHEDDDPDDDEVENLSEFQSGSNPHLTDTDGDGIGDYSEIAGQGTTPGGIVWSYDIHPGKADTDGDTQNDLYEIENGKDPTDPGSKVVSDTGSSLSGANHLAPVDGSPAPTSSFWTFGVVDDSDGDGFSDAQEQLDGTDPDDSTDIRSQLSVGLDADRDGLPDDWELANGLDPSDSTQGWRDSDYDRLNNIREHAQNTSPVGTWIPVALSGMIPEGALVGQDPRFPSSTLATFNDFNEMARASLDSGQISISIFDGSTWGQPENIPLPFTPVSFGEVVCNNFGLLAVEVRKSTPDGEHVMIVLRDAENQIHLVGADSAWTDISGIRVTDSGFVAAQVVGPLPGANESIVRWRKGALLELPLSGAAQLRGLNERGELLDGIRGLYRGGSWDDEFAGNQVLGHYGEVSVAPAYPMPGAAFPYVRFSSMSLHGEIISGVSLIDPDEVVRGYHARYLSSLGEFVITEDDWLGISNEPFLDDPEIPSGGIWSEGAGGNFTYYFDGPGTPIYDFDFDYDDDGFWNDLESTASTDPNSSADFPGVDANVVVSDANEAGDFVGWIYRGIKEYDAASGLEIPQNEAYLWQYREFRFFGGSDHTWVINNTGAFISSDLIPVESPDFSSSGTYHIGHQFRLFRPDNDLNANRMADHWEAYHAVTSPSADLDGDGLTARQEFVFGTSPNHTDTDGDGLRDGWELKNGTNPRRRDIGLGGDLDGDTLGWLTESQAGTDPHLSDTDGDGVRDDLEVKHDRNPLDPSDGLPGDGDFDGDGFSNADERAAGTDPFDDTSNANTIDSDGDGMADVWEVQYGLDPTNPADGGEDPDYDRVTNAQEYLQDTDPMPVWKTVDIEGGIGIVDDASPWWLMHGVGRESLNDRGEISNAYFVGDRLKLRLWTAGTGWGDEQDFGPADEFTNVQTIVRNNFGLTAAVVRRIHPVRPEDPNDDVFVQSELRVMTPTGNLYVVGRPKNWLHISNVSITDTGYVTANAQKDGNWRLVQWREGLLQADGFLTESLNSDSIVGVSESAKVVDSDRGVFRFGKWEPVSPAPSGITRRGRIFFSGKENVKGDVLTGIWPKSANPNYLTEGWAIIRPSGGSPYRLTTLGDFPYYPGYNYDGSGYYYDDTGNSVSVPHGHDPDLNGAGYLVVSDLNESGAVAGWQTVSQENPSTLQPEMVTSGFLWQGKKFGRITLGHNSHIWKLNNFGHALMSIVEKYPDNNAPYTYDSDGDGVLDSYQDSFGSSTSTPPSMSVFKWKLLKPDNDADDDNLPDDWETLHNITDPAEDPDFDLLTNWQELAFGTDPNESDSDGDLYLDRVELQFGANPLVDEGIPAADTDNDGLNDLVEAFFGSDPDLWDSDEDEVYDIDEVNLYGSNPNAYDTDGDGLSDREERSWGTNILFEDTDDDGMSDKFELDNDYDPVTASRLDDLDGDGMNDSWEQLHGMNTSSDDSMLDLDSDGIPNLYEFLLNTNPSKAVSKPIPDATVNIQSGSNSSTDTIFSTIEQALQYVQTLPPTKATAFIKVKSGTYDEHVAVSGRRVILTGENGVDEVVISPSTAGPAIRLYSPAIFDGFVVTHGEGVPGRGIEIDPVWIDKPGSIEFRIVNSIIRGNAYDFGAGLNITQGWVSIDHVSFLDNFAHDGTHSLSASDKVFGSLRCSVVLAGNAPEDSIRISGPFRVDSPTRSRFLSASYRPELSDLGLSAEGLAAGAPANGGAFRVVPVAARDFHGEIRSMPTSFGADEFVDADGDFLPDFWEDIIGFDSGSSDENTNQVIDGYDDFDGDGILNIFEYFQGSDPVGQGSGAILSIGSIGVGATPGIAADRGVELSLELSQSRIVTLEYWKIEYPVTGIYDGVTKEGGELGAPIYSLLHTRVVSLPIGTSMVSWNGVVSNGMVHDAAFIAVALKHDSTAGGNSVVVNSKENWVNVPRNVPSAAVGWNLVDGTNWYRNSTVAVSHGANTGPPSIMHERKLQQLGRAKAWTRARNFEWIPLTDQGEFFYIANQTEKVSYEGRYLPPFSVVFEEPEILRYSVDLFEVSPESGEVANINFELSAAAEVTLEMVLPNLTAVPVHIADPQTGELVPAVDIPVEAGSNEIEVFVGDGTPGGATIGDWRLFGNDSLGAPSEVFDGFVKIKLIARDPYSGKEQFRFAYTRVTPVE